MDRVAVRVMREGKSKGGMIPSAHLGAMLQAETFLNQFPPVDQVTSVPMYLPDFTLPSLATTMAAMATVSSTWGTSRKCPNSMDTIKSSWA